MSTLPLMSDGWLADVGAVSLTSLVPSSTDTRLQAFDTLKLGQAGV